MSKNTRMILMLQVFHLCPRNVLVSISVVLDLIHHFIQLWYCVFLQPLFFWLLCIYAGDVYLPLLAIEVPQICSQLWYLPIFTHTGHPPRFISRYKLQVIQNTLLLAAKGDTSSSWQRTFGRDLGWRTCLCSGWLQLWLPCWQIFLWRKYGGGENEVEGWVSLIFDVGFGFGF